MEPGIAVQHRFYRLRQGPTGKTTTAKAPNRQLEASRVDSSFGRITPGPGRRPSQKPENTRDFGQGKRPEGAKNVRRIMCAGLLPGQATRAGKFLDVGGATGWYDGIVFAFQG